MRSPAIEVEGARQNNLKGISVSVPLGAVTAITGVAGAGKSSLAFDVLFAEGQRRYAETFSPYARQFLERLDRPQALRIEGVLPAVAIDRSAPVRSSRSTVGTLASVADYLRALYARLATLHCPGCERPVRPDTPASIGAELLRGAAGEERLLVFARPRPAGLPAELLRQGLAEAGFRRLLEDGQVVGLDEARLEPAAGRVQVVYDRVRLEPAQRQRLLDSLESALRWGQGRLSVHRSAGDPHGQPYSSERSCVPCDRRYAAPTPALFSFNNPLGACPACRGFGRTLEIDPARVVPDPGLSLEDHCLRPFRTPAYADWRRALLRHARLHGIPRDRPWRELEPATRAALWEGEPGAAPGHGWAGVRGFFAWLETRTYRRHVRVLLSRYRRQQPCTTCHGTRLKPEAGWYRLAGLSLPALEALPLARAAELIAGCDPGGDTATALLLEELRGRLHFLVEVGLGYLTLARASRTLSGGEAQRVALATALGGALAGTLYVLDEPSVGLHARDSGLLAGVLRRLAGAGNAVVVVEHDPGLVTAADHVIDLGPGAGPRGGELVYAGPFAGLLHAEGSLTGAYLSGRSSVAAPGPRREPNPQRRLRVVNARENNLRALSVDVPLDLLVCVTGVSGSGKSTLVDQVLYRNLRRHFGSADGEPGACDGLQGVEQVAAVSLVDQRPLGASARVTAATYLGLLGPLRQAFASGPEARARGLGPAAFSFNSAAGACPHCRGAGFERVELQFLPDALVRCSACDGRRYRPAVLEVRYRGYDIAALLDLPAADVARVLADQPRVVRALQPLLEVGLGYLRLSQPAPTLSGGEAQRLKLAAHLAALAQVRHHLLLLDEPTTGLHPADVATLVHALRRLIAAGASVVVVEHDLDVAAAADWIIDLGPEAGDGGGRLVCEGPPERVAQVPSPTGRALRARLDRGVRSEAWSAGEGPALPAPGPAAIRIRGAREHNLRGVDVDLPRGRLIAVTGVSGSGKSTLAFDVLFAEGQRRFLDCQSSYVRQFLQPLARPAVDRVEGLPPTVALEQKLSHGTPLSTAGTVSEVYHYLRLLFSALGEPHCARCGLAGATGDAAGLAAQLRRDFPGVPLVLFAPLVRARKGRHAELLAALARRGVRHLRIDGRWHDARRPVPLARWTAHDIDALVDRVVADEAHRAALEAAVARALELGSGSLLALGARGHERLYSTRRACPRCGAGLAAPDPRLFAWSQHSGACPACEGLGIAADGDRRCPACGGTRLRPEALAVKLAGRNIGEVAALSVSAARTWLRDLATHGPVLERLLPELERRLAWLERLGLGYLGLDRASPSLSTGEAQRVRIAAALASNLRGVCYVLDEPTVGLHPRDSQALVSALGELRDRGNTVVVVEHEEAVVRAADLVIDLGPAAGAAGGQVVAVGTPEALAAEPGSLTGRWLAGRGARPPWPRRPLQGAPCLRLRGARRHNLRGLDVELPLERLVCITGVSGSGKSTLVREILLPELRARLAGRRVAAGRLRSLRGAPRLRRVLEVDEAPIGRTPRSVPATYVGAMDALRRLFAELPEARAHGYRAARFSFNSGDGRCERCAGQGRLRVALALLPEVYVPCESCAGRRYNAATLAVTFKGRTLADVLALSVDEARTLFAAFPALRRPLDWLSELGLGYLRLGQPSSTLSGGEAQRIKLAAELAAPGAGPTLYVLDEPSTGLHPADVARLVAALQRLVERGDSVLAIEHDLEVVAAADCVIDLGPEAGQAGGQVVAWGPPEQVARSRRSRSAPYLKRFLADSARAGGGTSRPARRPRRSVPAADPRVSASASGGATAPPGRRRRAR